MRASSVQLSSSDERRFAEVRAALRTLHLERPVDHIDVTSDLRELLRTEVVTAYGLLETGDGRRDFAFCYTAGGDIEQFRSSALALFERHPLRFGMFNPDRPEPDQRNVVRSWAPGVLEALPNANTIPAIPLYRTIGVGGFGHLRLLACEDASLLSWIGAWQDGPYEQHQIALLAALVPDIRQRLAVERQLAQGGRYALLDATLEAVASASFVLTSRGNIRHANAAGRALLQRERRELHGELRAACHARTPTGRWDVTPTSTRAGSVEYLVRLRASADTQLHARVAHAAARWGLTPRQRDVLAKLAEGRTNVNIGATLGISERTVEVHVTALLAKAQVGSRAELLATLFTIA